MGAGLPEPPFMKLPRGIIFDFDGVLVDTEWAIFNSWVELYHREGCKLTVQDYSPCLGAGYTHWDPASHLESLTGKHFNWDQENARRQANIEQRLIHSGLMPGARELLEWCCSMGIRLTVASSSSRSWVAGWLNRLNAMHFFPEIFCRTDGYAVKPAPALFLAAQNFLALPVEDCLVVEDSRNGLLAANAAGIRSVAIPCRLTRKLDLSAADFHMKSLSELHLSLAKASKTQSIT